MEFFQISECFLPEIFNELILVLAKKSVQNFPLHCVEKSEQTFGQSYLTISFNVIDNNQTKIQMNIILIKHRVNWQRQLYFKHNQSTTYLSCCQCKLNSIFDTLYMLYKVSSCRLSFGWLFMFTGLSLGKKNTPRSFINHFNNVDRNKIVLPTNA